ADCEDAHLLHTTWNYERAAGLEDRVATSANGCILHIHKSICSEKINELKRNIKNSEKISIYYEYEYIIRGHRTQISKIF
ncbi:hypothetical protein NL533_33090, partial [Klebsiella pneumoniae]|nr:hypothetical protein [Klebsiella pneumoniae]